MLVDSGRSDLLACITGQLAVDTYQMGLYTNNYALLETDTFAALTECAVAGYARQNLSGWSAPTNIGGGVWDSIAGNATFLNTGGSAVTIYGFFYFGISRGIFYGGALLAAPLILPAGGNLIFAPSWNDTTN